MSVLEQLRSGALAGTRALRLNGCGLADFPEEIFALADTLELLDLSDNHLTQLPAALPRLRHLKVLFCSGNPFTVLPPVLGQCAQLEMVGFKSCRIASVPGAALPPRLRWLILTDNCITDLPEAMGDCQRLQKLMLAGNRLHTLPERMRACSSLELVRLSANQLPMLPEWLLQLPRLAWLAYGGNPLTLQQEQVALHDTHIADIPWSQLHLREVLGQGASGLIQRAEWRLPAGATEAVAVKLFKGAMTSDGLPQSEMAAWLRAGQHAGVVGIVGRIRAHPQQAHGLVMPLHQGCRALAGPPSLQSCTRDVYAHAQGFSLPQVRTMARAMADALAHVHRQGVLHGDFYAHNMLHDGGDALWLGDFGAASLLPVEAAQALALQRIEVRAWGYWLQELLARCTATDAASLAGLQQLCRDCVLELPAQRPLLAQVVQRLDALQDEGITPQV